MALNDTFVTAPVELSGAISKAGGDPSRVVKWFDCGKGAVYRCAVTGTSAEDAWRSLRDDFKNTGHWPIILGSSESVRTHNDLLENTKDGTFDSIMEKAKSVDLDTWQKAHQKAIAGMDPEYRRPHSESGWPDPESVKHHDKYLATVDVLSDKPLNEVWIGLVPVKHSWEVPAVMRFGDWNAVPPPEIHVAMLKRWNKQFEAELVSMTNEVMEFHVTRPPDSKDAALKLAELQYDYCPDIVEQGVNSIEALAATLLNDGRWYFWWD